MIAVINIEHRGQSSYQKCPIKILKFFKIFIKMKAATQNQEGIIIRKEGQLRPIFIISR